MGHLLDAFVIRQKLGGELLVEQVCRPCAGGRSWPPSGSRPWGRGGPRPAQGKCPQRAGAPAGARRA